MRIHSSTHCTDYQIQSADSSIVLLAKTDVHKVAPDSTLLPLPAGEADRKERSPEYAPHRKRGRVRDHVSPQTWLALTGETVLSYILRASNTWVLARRRHRWTNMRLQRRNLYLWHSSTHTTCSDRYLQVLLLCSQNKYPLGWWYQAEFLLCVYRQPCAAVT